LYCLQIHSKNYCSLIFIFLILHVMSCFANLHDFSPWRLKTPSGLSRSPIRKWKCIVKLHLWSRRKNRIRATLENLYRGTMSCGSAWVVSCTSRPRTGHQKVITDTFTFMKIICGGGFEKICKESWTILRDGVNVLFENRV